MRVLILNDPAAAAELRITPALVGDALARHPGLAEAIDLRFAPVDADPMAEIAACDPHAIFAGRSIDIALARATAPSLRWVQVTSAGVDKYVERLPDDVVLTNASGVHGEKAAEFCLAAALMLAYRIPVFVTDKERRAWEPVYGGTIGGKRVTLLGVGAIGTAVARLLKPFGVRLTGVTRTGSHEPAIDRSIGAAELDAALAETDILISSLPLTRATSGLIDRRRIGLLPDGAGIVVVGRAKVFDYDAMMDRLEAGTLGGAVLDVYPVEPVPPDDRLWRCPRLIMTPHCSLDDHVHYARRCVEIFVDNLARRVAGAPLVNAVDRDGGY